MTLKKTIRARYRYTGDSDGWYKCGKEYSITVHYKRRLWKKYIEVTCRHGYHDEVYAGCPPIVYGDEGAFQADWVRV